MGVALIYSTIIVCFATFGVSSNLFLIYLILRYTMKEMQVYSKILLQTCIIDIITLIAFSLCQPNYASDNGVGTAWNYGPIHLLPNPWQTLILRFNYFMGRLTIMNVLTLFIYRYLTVVCNVNENEHLTNYELAKIFDLDNRTIENYVVGLRSRTNNLSNFVTNYDTALTIINYIIIIFCGIIIQLHIYRHCKGTRMSKIRNMNKQITIVLISQVTILTIRNYRQVIFRCKNNQNFSSSIVQIVPIQGSLMTGQ
ncbi:hypothetical protein Mgra_00001063 [Meloidogyne graminicola]|uniref:Uncharacterized protein n=1 Tax=Meloidogyne graminicola TaxID=189291 RepID=A0A8T0A317_9BILA|nr:hypothetical protein Mgra_00001063 [Meloidogyne graminicola]